MYLNHTKFLCASNINNLWTDYIMGEEVTEQNRGFEKCRNVKRNDHEGTHYLQTVLELCHLTHFASYISYCTQHRRFVRIILCIHLL